MDFLDLTEALLIMLDLISPLNEARMDVLRDDVLRSSTGGLSSCFLERKWSKIVKLSILNFI